MKILFPFISIILLSKVTISQSLNWAEFQYLTKFETTIFDEKIKFFNGDTLWGWTHSNDQLAIMQSPVFYGLVTTTAESFWQGSGYNPQFYGPEPIFNYPEIEFPIDLSELRIQADLQDRLFIHEGFQFRLIFRGSQGLEIIEWPLGLPFYDSLLTIIYTSPPINNGVIFIEGKLEITGTDSYNHVDMGIEGRLSIGCSENIWILDNLRYIDSNLMTGAIDSSTDNILGLLSEKNILIANTFENGRNNGGNSYPNNPWRSDIIINGGLVSLGESFSFEDQNDVIEAYGGQLPEWYYSNGTNPDERGQIHLWGGIAQYRRGYVHRSNHGGTGYTKNYHFYPNFTNNPPPFFISVPFGLSFSADTLDFGEIILGDSLILPLTIYNNNIDTIDIIDHSCSSPDFSSNLEPNLLAPNDSLQILVCFRPNISGAYNEVFNINTIIGTYTIVLIGIGDNTNTLSGPLNGILLDTTYIVLADIYVQNGDSLIIFGGTTLLFNDDISFEINGYLNATGSYHNNIIFSSRDENRFWHGISFNSTSNDSSILRYCQISRSRSSGIEIYASPKIENCLITENSSDCGGGIFCWYSANPVIKNCVISNNSASSGSGIYCLSEANPTVVNSVIDNNNGGSAVYFSIFTGTSILFCDFYNNESGHFSGTIPEYLGVLINTNFNGDSCDIFNNIFLDPQYYSTTGDSAFYLTADSPCIDAGDPESPLDPDSTIADIGAFYYNQGTAFVKKPSNIILPSEYSLHSPYPNPFNPVTTISFDIPKACNVLLIVYDVSGREVARLVDGFKSAGVHEIIFDGSDFSSGIYFARLQADGFSQTRKMLLVK